jgi:hypothetical protein
VALSGRLPRFGYTDRQAAFLRLVALHSGYFVARQYDQFIGAGPGGPRRRFLVQVAAKGHVRNLPSCDRTVIYHLCARRFYAALGIENSRNRRPHEPFGVKTKLMTLDFVLRHPAVQFLSTEDEKMDLTETLKLSPVILPSKVYNAKGHASRTVRHFVDRNPIFLSPAAEGAAPVVSFAYIDASSESTAGFRTYLLQYRSLLQALKASRLVYVANCTQRFEQAGKDFAELLGLNEATDPLGSVDGTRLLQHFEARACHERGDYRSFDTEKIERLRCELREFKGPAFDALFGVFQSHGAGAMLAERARLKALQRTPRVTFETELIPNSYAFLGLV